MFRRLSLLILWFYLGVIALPAAETPIKVALYDGSGSTGKGIPRVSAHLTNCAGIKLSRLSPKQIQSGALKDFDVVIFTGGSASLQAKTLGPEGRKQVQTFVEQGGGYIGICAGAYLACGFDWGLGILDARTVSSKWKRGTGTVKIELTEKGQDLFGQTNKLFSIHYANGPIIKPANSDSLPDYSPLAHFRTELAENGSPVGIMVDAPAIVRSTFGKGRVMVFSPHPEQSEGLVEFVSHAVRWVAGR